MQKHLQSHSTENKQLGMPKHIIYLYSSNIDKLIQRDGYACRITYKTNENVIYVC